MSYHGGVPEGGGEGPIRFKVVGGGDLGVLCLLGGLKRRDMGFREGLGSSGARIRMF